MTSFDPELSALGAFLERYPKLAVLTGAGVSVASGIPAYRDADGVWQHASPITQQDFEHSAARRRRYWSRSLQGWPVIRDARPNQAHLALAQLERQGHIKLLITQNVDRLHQRAGSTKVIDLHGRVDSVACLNCEAQVSRELVQQRLLRANPSVTPKAVRLRPDGDADTRHDSVEDFEVPACENCGGVLIPDVVFFGGTVPRQRVEDCSNAISEADALLAVGSSLQVYSGFRFCRLAGQLGKPIAIINPGATRADPLASLKLEADCGPLLAALAGGGGVGALRNPYASGSPN